MRKKWRLRKINVDTKQRAGSEMEKKKLDKNGRMKDAREIRKLGEA